MQRGHSRAAGLMDTTIENFIVCQRESAKGQRQEMLGKDLHGTILLLRNVIMPIFGSLEGFQLEYEFAGPGGYRFFADVYYEPLRMIIECDGYVPHVELMTRDRFSLDRQRLRCMALGGYLFVPFSRDELEKKPDSCKRSIYELLGRYDQSAGGMQRLDPRERELIRHAARGGLFTMTEAGLWLQVGKSAARRRVRKMMDDGWIVPEHIGKTRIHRYRLGEKGLQLLSERR
ncbi:hypothetical protein SAMN05880570_4151 [Paenibacillus sp. RU4T]|nr:hypothetical protein SAMN05880555_4149 [Paenibacillus sp. RU4X]SIR63238.1 hypothetical protein SAMN05880570_4151 [Paenibacillus sp. RU4T]